MDAGKEHTREFVAGIARRAAARVLSAAHGNEVGRPRETARSPFAQGSLPLRGGSPTHLPGESRSNESGGQRAAGASLYGKSMQGGPRSAAEDVGGRDLVGESLVRAAAPGSDLVVPPHSSITPLARELAFQKGVRFVTGRYAEPLGPIDGAPGAQRARRIAVASDHGGFALKAQLLLLLRELGERPVDHGPAVGDVSVDYPGFAATVAREVSEGRATLGVIVDGAGIGSAMVANKFPGVRAANCWDERSARNAREHNHANVLTLGAGHLDLAAAHAVVAAFLSTPVGEGRHARRAGLIDAIEADNLRPRSLTQVFDDER